VRGAGAGGVLGPDLTHLMTRGTLAAGLLPNTPGNLAAWIANPQTLKPGSRMPAPQLSPAELQSVIGYLETLH
jgi:cytochrome c oxidase subunit 2